MQLRQSARLQAEERQLERAVSTYGDTLSLKAWSWWLQALQRKRKAAQLNARFATRLVRHTMCAWTKQSERVALEIAQMAHAVCKRTQTLCKRILHAWAASFAETKQRLEHELNAAQHCIWLYTQRAVREWCRRVANKRNERAAQSDLKADLLCRGWGAWRQVFGHRRYAPLHNGTRRVCDGGCVKSALE